MDIEERLGSIERRLEKLEVVAAESLASNRLATKLIKFVILPLILILGGLVGVKIM